MHLPRTSNSAIRGCVCCWCTIWGDMSKFGILIFTLTRHETRLARMKAVRVPHSWGWDLNLPTSYLLYIRSASSLLPQMDASAYPIDASWKGTDCSWRSHIKCTHLCPFVLCDISLKITGTCCLFADPCPIQTRMSSLCASPLTTQIATRTSQRSGF